MHGIVYMSMCVYVTDYHVTPSRVAQVKGTDSNPRWTLRVGRRRFGRMRHFYIGILGHLLASVTILKYFDNFHNF